MRTLTLALLVAFSLSTFQLIAQTTSDFSWALSVQWWELAPMEVEDSQSQIAAPFFLVQESRALKLSKRWKLGADIRLLRNARPYIRYRAEVYETVHCSVPLYLSFACTKDLFIEGGIYAGVLLNNPNLPEDIL